MEPRQKPGRSEQNVMTSREFVAAVQRTFGALICDLAASRDNAVAGDWRGPEHPAEALRDATTCQWPLTRQGEHCWLNPPFGNIAPFAKRAAESRQFTSTLMLVPASVGANWWCDWVDGKADVYVVGRMRFVGHDHMFPKDLALCHYWALSGGKQRRWRWER